MRPLQRRRNNDIAGAMKDIKAAVKAEAAAAGAASLRLPLLPRPRRKADGARIFASPLARRIAARRARSVGHRRHRPAWPHRQVRCREAPSRVRPGRRRRGAPAAGRRRRHPGVAALPDARLLYPAGSYEEIPHDSMRKAIAKRLTSAKTLIPHYYLTIDCNLDQLMAVREKMNARRAQGKDKVPPTSSRSTTSS